ncbi:MAG: DUF5631 domain-containing protein [Mycobacterium sp.]|uniref:DUF5631 domain-containing protein n=1 Tax=Mycobacterium sp. TaxID=1785 RepID=UPI0026023348|nr:DUF5631 domain-containing protein [Mycobacterium sp.]MDI3313215.1 DUF5631 domain-containing protein [Mycobacterium sp.]
MAIFGRKTARQRLRKATRESLRTPAFSASADCTPWVIGGLWPTELSTVTTETAPLAAYLKADLQRIANSANQELHALRRAAMTEPARQAAEARVIRIARDYAVRRVESTVRQLRTAVREAPDRHPNLAEDLAPGVKTAQLPVTVVMPPGDLETSSASPEPRQDDGELRALRIIETSGTAMVNSAIMDATGDLGVVSGVSVGRHAEDREAGAVAGDAVTNGRHTEAASERTVVTPHAQGPAAGPESARQRLGRLLEFVARQEPGLRWAVGDRQDGTTILLTDVAHGWVPPGIALPAGVQLLTPGWRGGNVTALLGPTTLSATYTPGDSLGRPVEPDATEASPQPRELPVVEDLGWLLGEATRWRDGLPRLAHTLAKAGAAGTGVADVEIDVLRVHLEIARYTLLARYPDIDTAQLLNCLLLAATEGIATGDRVSANYHFSWFQALSNPPVSSWGTHQ